MFLFEYQGVEDLLTHLHTLSSMFASLDLESMLVSAALLQDDCRFKSWHDTCAGCACASLCQSGSSFPMRGYWTSLGASGVWQSIAHVETAHDLEQHFAIADSLDRPE